MKFLIEDEILLKDEVSRLCAFRELSNEFPKIMPKINTIFGQSL